MDTLIIEEIAREYSRAKSKFPAWPTDPVHASAVVSEEVGELMREVLHMVYEPERASLDAIRSEAVQVAVTAIRFLEGLDRYAYIESERV